MRPDQRIQLTEAGQKRRAAMLGELQHAMHAHHQRRHAMRRTISVCGALLLIAGAAAYVITSAVANAPGAPTTVAAVAHESIVAPPSTPAVLIARIETDPAVLDRYRMSATRCAEILDDDALIQSLREIDRPAGIVRMNGEVWLTASVADGETLGAHQPNSL